MGSVLIVRAWSLVVAVAISIGAMTACGDNKSGAQGDARTSDAQRIDAAISQGAPCLDRPTDLLRPPSGQLPCELLPPGFVAEGQ